MKKVFICSPYRGETYRNALKAKQYCLDAMKQGFLPIAPHLYFPQFLDENYEQERTLGIEAGIELMQYCDEMWVYGELADGMKKEIEAWKLKDDFWVLSIKQKHV